LKFFLNAGFITDAEGKIAKMDEGAYPSSPPPVVDKLITGADLFSAVKGAIGLVTIDGDNQSRIAIQNRGTLFVVTASGYALMSSHLISDAYITDTIKISVNMGSASSPALPVEVIKTDRELGLTLVKVGGNVEYSDVKLSREQALLGDQVYVLGYPLGSDLTLITSNVYSLNENRGRIGITAPLLPGHSGSPVFNRKGEVIAIVSGSREGAGAVATPIQLSRSMLASIGLE
jgi:S1-C subfamily serine protease